MKKCPYCAEKIQDEAIKCKHCGEWIRDSKESDILKLINESINKIRTFISKENAKRKVRRHNHLFEPTDKKPMKLVASGWSPTKVKFYPQFLIWESSNSKVYYLKYRDIENLEFYNKTYKIFKTQVGAKVELYINFKDSEENLDLDFDLNLSIAKNSDFKGFNNLKDVKKEIYFIKSRLFGTGNSKKAMEKVPYIYSFLERIQKDSSSV